MATISSIDLFNALKDKVGEKEAKMLTEFMEYKADDSFEKAKSQLATRQDLSKLELTTKESISKLELATKESISKLELATKESISKLQLATTESISRLELSIKDNISNLNTHIKNLEIKISDVKSDIIKWIFTLFTPIYIAITVFIVRYIWQQFHL